MTPKPKIWTFPEFKVLMEVYPIDPKRAISLLPERTPTSIRSKAMQLGILACAPITPEELSIFERYGKSLGTAILVLLPNRTLSEVVMYLEKFNNNNNNRVNAKQLD